MMAVRRIAITKKVSLASVSDGWDDCYAIIRPATQQDYLDFASSDPEKLAPADQVKLEVNFVKDHFVSGKINVLGAGNQPELVDMEPDDIAASIDLANKLFFEIMGIKYDPKDLQTAALNKTPPTAS